MLRESVVVVVSTTAMIIGASGCRHTTDGEEADGGASVDASRADGTATDAGTDDATKPEDPVVAVTSGTTSTLRGVWLSADAALAVAVGDGGTIVASTDGGKSWGASTSGVTLALNAVWGASADEVWATGENGTVLRSVDRAKTWSPMALGATTKVVGIWGSSADQVFFVGANGTIYRTRDHGTTFPGRSVPNGLAMVGISGTSETDVWAIAASAMFHSTDAGETFTTTFANAAQQRGIWAGGLEDVYTVNDATVVTRYDGKVLHKHVALGGKLFAVWGSSTSDVYVVGEAGLVRHSVDRSRSWRKVDGASSDLHAVSGNGDVLLVAGAGGAILRR